MTMPRLPLVVRVAPALALAAVVTPARAAPWAPRPGIVLPDVDGVAQRVELVDIDADGFVDVALAHSRGDAVGGDGDAQLPQLLHNDGGLGFSELPIFDAPENAYAIKAGDLDGDGDPDLVVGVNFQGQSHALLNEGDGTFTRQDILPGQLFSVGDLELGDVDGDGVLDVVAVDWGPVQPHGAPGDPGGPVRLWLGVGDGTFVDGPMNLPMGLDNLASWSFDVELIDLDGDFDLDILVSARGPGNASALRNDGAGVFAPHPLPALQDIKGKDTNTAFAPIDLNGDGHLDVLTLQDGGDDCALIDGVQVCGNRNSVLIGDGQGQFVDNPGGYWPAVANPPRRDVDVATLDIDNSGTPDVLVIGPPLAPSDVVGRLLLGSGIGLDPTLTIPFPADPALNAAFSLMFADFDRDRREDVALAVRDDQHPSVVLFGRDDPLDGIPEDLEPPSISLLTVLPDLLLATSTHRVGARVHDRKTPTRWHDFRHDPDLDSYNLAPGTVTAHRRRLPWIEHALGLGDPQKLDMLPDTGPEKVIVPGVWVGEALWRIDVVAPIPKKQQDSLTWRICAMDAAGNKVCNGPFQVIVEIPGDSCGDGQVDPWEDCDDPNDPLCANCQSTCGDGVCAEPFEDAANCPTDCLCNHNGICEPPIESDANCVEDCSGGSSFCGDSKCSPPETVANCPQDCACDDDGVCDPAESASTCPQDCAPVCGDCVCEPPEDAATCALDCAFGSVCAKCGDGLCDTPTENSFNCPQDCPQVCGNCLCEPPETIDNCPQDCQAFACHVCGDNVCDFGIEDIDNCPMDCAPLCCNGICEPSENVINCPQDCGGSCDADDPACPQSCPTSDSATSGPGVADNAGCGCRTDGSAPLWLALLLLVLPRRRTRGR